MFLRNRVGRRVLGLFMLCALGPVTALAWLANRQVTIELAAATGESLHREARVATTMLHDRLARLHLGLADIAQRVGAGQSLPVTATGFRWLALADSAGWVEPATESPGRRRPWTTQQWARIRQGRPLMMTTPTGVVLLVARADDAIAVTGAVDLGRLWGVSGVDEKKSRAK